MRIGATSGVINEVKLGKELEEVLTKLIAMTPTSTTASNGNVFRSLVLSIISQCSITIVCVKYEMLTSELIIALNYNYTYSVCYEGSSSSALMSIDDKESTKVVLEVVAVAQSNGLKLPREFGLLLKQA